MKDHEPIPVAIALIRKVESSGTLWLGRWNHVTETLRFVFTYPDSKAAMRQSIADAVSWEFQLDPQKDLVVSSMAQLNYEFPESVPAVANKQPLLVAFYNVELYGKKARAQVNQDTGNHWLSSQEIWEGISKQGLRVDPLIQQLVSGSQVIQEWESSH